MFLNRQFSSCWLVRGLRVHSDASLHFVLSHQVIHSARIRKIILGLNILFSVVKCVISCIWLLCTHQTSWSPTNSINCPLFSFLSFYIFDSFWRIPLNILLPADCSKLFGSSQKCVFPSCFFTGSCVLWGLKHSSNIYFFFMFSKSTCQWKYNIRVGSAQYPSLNNVFQTLRCTLLTYCFVLNCRI